MFGVHEAEMKAPGNRACGGVLGQWTEDYQQASTLAHPRRYLIKTGKNAGLCVSTEGYLVNDFFPLNSKLWNKKK